MEMSLDIEKKKNNKNKKLSGHTSNFYFSWEYHAFSRSDARSTMFVPFYNSTYYKKK